MLSEPLLFLFVGFSLGMEIISLNFETLSAMVLFTALYSGTQPFKHYILEHSHYKEQHFYEFLKLHLHS